MKRLLLFLTVYFINEVSFSQTLEEFESKRVKLSNGWSLTPAGRSLALGDLPLNIAVSSSKKYMAVTNSGQSVHSIQLIDVQREKILDDKTVPKAWYGLKFSADEKFLYASGGNDNWILKYAVADKKLLYISCWGCDKVYIYNTETKKFSKKIPVGDNPNELCLTKNGKYLFVANANDNSVSVINTSEQKVMETLTASLFPDAPPGS